MEEPQQEQDSYNLRGTTKLLGEDKAARSRVTAIAVLQ